MRVFAAVALEPAAVGVLAAAVRDLCHELPGLTPVRPEAIHLTLRFYGEVADADGDRLTELLAGRRLETPRTRLVVGGYGQFPPRGQPRVLWTGLREGAEAARSLAREVNALTAAIGEPPEAVYTPHVTLARDRRGACRGREAVLDRFRRALDALSLDTTAAGVSLYRSELGPTGPRYTILGEAMCAR